MSTKSEKQYILTETELINITSFFNEELCNNIHCILTGVCRTCPNKCNHCNWDDEKFWSAREVHEDNRIELTGTDALTMIYTVADAYKAHEGMCDDQLIDEYEECLKDCSMCSFDPDTCECITVTGLKRTAIKMLCEKRGVDL